MDYRHGRRPSYLRVVVFVTWSVFASASFAGMAIIDRAAQEQLLQQERERQLREQQQPAPDVRLTTPEPQSDLLVYPDNESPCFPISNFILIGEHAEKFQFALSTVKDGAESAIGRCLGAKGINVAMSRVQNAIIERGFVTTRVLAAPRI